MLVKEGIVMWTREELKRNAKIVLKRNYWLTFAVILVSQLIVGVIGDLNAIVDVAVELEVSVPESIVMGASVFSLLVTIFISGPIMVGRKRFMMQSREYDTEFSTLFSGFNSQEFGNNVKVMLVRDIKIALWTFLLIIPGIVKSYEYYFVPYILAENPDLPKDKVFAISKEMTRGYKWDIFVLELSFFGWYLLGAFCLVIGSYFVMPYPEATLAELYAAQRAHVLSAGIVGEDELRGFSGYTQDNYTDWQ